MNMDTPGNVAGRRAALLVHAMPPADRLWLLAALPLPARERLEALLAELRSLEVPPDSDLLRELADAPVSSAGEPAEDRIGRLDKAEVRSLVRILRGEPAAVAVRVLGMRPWPWKAAVLAQLPPAVARSVRGAPSLAPALERYLCEALLRRLRAEQPRAGASLGDRLRDVFVLLALRGRAR